MDEVTRISEKAINDISSRTRFNSSLILKDYYITVILYLIKDVGGIYFKGGTALQKIILNYSRISEDIDFTLTRQLSLVKKEIEDILVKSKLFDEISEDKNVDGFTRMVVHYKDFLGAEGTIFIDLNQRGKLLTKPEKNEISHLYHEIIPKFSINTLSREEMISEKIAATIGRNKPRDHYDVYQILKRNIPINLVLARKKCKSSGDEFSIIKMFNQAQKLHRRWHEDMASLLAEDVSFQEVMTTLSKHFKLKEEKEKLKDRK